MFIFNQNTLPSIGSRIFHSDDQKRPIRIVSHLVGCVAIAKFRPTVVFRVIAQAVQNRARGHAQKIQDVLLAVYVVHHDVFITYSFFDSGHIYQGVRKTLQNKILAQRPLHRRVLSRVGLALALVALPWSSNLVIADQGSPAVVINELAWMGSSSSTADEWLELRNLTANSIDLSGWRITKLSSGSETTMTEIPPGNVVAADGYFLIANYAATHPSSSLHVTPDIVDTDMALSNSALQIKLYDQAGVLQDTADDGVGNPLSGQYSSAEKIFQSMERNPVPGDGVVAESWHSASAGLGFKEGKTEFGTPRTANSNGLPVAAAGDDQSGTVNQEINFDGSDSTDPEGGQISYLWNFGDTTTSVEATPRHSYSAVGTYAVTLTVSDGMNTATDTAKVEISAAQSAIPTTPIVTPSLPAASTPPTTSCRGISLTEIFPNPEGVDTNEFLEFYNPTNASIIVDGCTVWLNDKRKHIVKSLTIQPKHYMIIEKTVSKLSLTNAGGSVRLVDTDGVELATVSYPKAPNAESWALIGQEWLWTNQVTAGKKNLVPRDDEPDEKRTATKTEVTRLSVGLNDIQTLESGTAITIQGVVTVEADRLGTRTLFLQSDSGAVSVVVPKEVGRVTRGDLVQITGQVRLSQGRKRIAADRDGVKVLSASKSITPTAIALDQLSSEFADALVSVQGVISSSSGAKFLIDDGTAEGEIYLKSSTGIIKPRSATGDRLVVVGIVSVSTSGIRVLPRTIEDLRVERVLGAATVATPIAKNLPTAPPHQNQWYWGFVVVGVVAAGIKPGLAYIRKRKNPASDGRIEV